MINDEIYVLTKHGGFSAEYIEKIPVYRRRFFIHKLTKEIEDTNEQIRKNSKK